MSIFSDILGKIFPSTHPAVAQSTASTASAASAAPATSASPAAATAAGPTSPPVDVAAILEEKARKNPEKLNWRSSIVDLLKLLDLDSSLASRKALAAELKYTGDTNDSATMNIWLHKQVMQKLAENGGVVPNDLKA